jgi:hypothetical protein
LLPSSSRLMWKRVELVGKLPRGLLLSLSKTYWKTIATP